jgi:hypothetical protein
MPPVAMPFNSQKPFLHLWRKYNYRVTNGASYDSLQINAKNIKGFKEDVGQRISEMGKSKFVRATSSRAEADVSASLVYAFLQMILSPDSKQRQLLDAIYAAHLPADAVTARALSESVGMNINSVRNYMRILETLKAAELVSAYEGLTIKSVDRDMMKAWFKEFLDGGANQGKGGIDMRALQATGAAAARKTFRAGSVQRVAPDMLQRQWDNIRQDLAAGRMPYDKIGGYVTQCSAQGARKELMVALDYIASLLRMEEACAVSTPQQMKDILAALNG